MQQNVHIFSSFLYAKLVQKGIKEEDRFSEAVKWSKTQVTQFFQNNHLQKRIVKHIRCAGLLIRVRRIALIRV